MSFNSKPTGRYAPSPTGMLHLGNLRTALACWASIRAGGGKFLLRIEDVDEDRSKPHFEELQLEDLRRLGVDWDEEPVRQSERSELYEEALQKLIEKRLAYPCFCSRKDIQEALSAPHEDRRGGEGGYPGTCECLSLEEARGRIEAGERHSWRVRVSQAPKLFFDGFRGEERVALDDEGGDFVVKRADGHFAYQLACAVDDGLQEMTEVLRGNDLLVSGARQAYLLACLDLPVPRYLHIPLMLGPDGEKLSKREGGDDLRSYEERGYDCTAVRSYLAWTLGISELGKRLEAKDIPGRWDIRKMPTSNVQFSEDDLKRFAE